MLPFVIIRIKDLKFAIPAAIIHEMVATPAVTQVPASRPYVRGVINLRGQVIPAVDLRRVIGFTDHQHESAERIEMLKAREQDHINWMNELEKSVQQGSQFSLALDPHKCAFGRWYDTYKSSNVVVTNHLSKFDEPHQQIHRIGVEVIALTKQGNQSEAMKIIEATRGGDLHRLRDLFADLYAILSKANREIAIVLEHGSSKVALLVDEIQSVRQLGEYQQVDESMSLNIDLPVVKGYVIEEAGALIALLDVERLGLFDKLLAA